jgi:hypothetical protein
MSRNRRRRSTDPPPGALARRARPRWFGYVILLVPLYFLLLNQVGGSPVRTLTIAYVAFLIGTIMELLRVTKDPKQTAWLFFCALAVSVFNFLPYKREQGYSFQSHLDNWPIVFVLFLLLAMIALYGKRLTARIGEGATMLLSIAFFYWMLDRFYSESGPLWAVILAAVPVLYCVIHALTDIELSPRVRLGLSLWSAMVMAAFAVRYVMALLQMGSIENRLMESDFEQATRLLAEYVLLGAAGAYILQNVNMLLGYVPGRDTFFNQRYFREARELTAAHIARYSPQQVPLAEALVVLALVLLLLVLHWLFRPVSTGFVLWLILAGVPWVMDIGTGLLWMRRGPTDPKEIPAGESG